MIAEKIISQINSLPDEIQLLAYEYINNLKINYASSNERIESKNIIKDDEFYGIWRNNEEMNDSSGFVKNLRKIEFENV